MILLRDRIKALMDYSGMSVNEFSKYLGLKSSSAIREIVNGRTKTLSDAVGIHITLTYPNINQEWLHNGRGEMFKETQQERFDVGVGVGQQKGGKNNFKIEVKDDLNPSANISKATDSNPQSEVAYLRQLLAEKDARIAELTASLERERIMNDFLMKQK